MSGPTPTGNSCTLEDCYTNIFALTDICGIKWRKLCIEPSQCQMDPMDDPVLSSYASCLENDILCVWRRVAKHSEARPTDISFGKELWIFWYGDRPSALDNILSPELKENEYGSWEKDSVLSYECRTLLFKALHNLIERCLLSKNFIRLGRWFVQPYDPLSGAEQGNNLSFCFNFFLHGESTVCASIEVKQHPPVTPMTIHHLNHVQESGVHMNVILAPYGLNGMLTGVSCRDQEQPPSRVFGEWKRFYPVKVDDNKDEMNRLPNVVEILVAGVRMNYPSCYVLMVDDHPPPGMDHSMPRHNNLHPSTMVGHQGGLHEDPGLLGDGGQRGRTLEPVSELTSKTGRVLGTKLVERICQDSCVTAGLSKRLTDGTEESAAGTWDLSDPTSRTSCNCSRLRGKNKSSSGLPGKQLEKKKGDKALERQQSRLLRTTPFHRRTQTLEDFVQYDMDMFMPRVTTNSNVVNSSGLQVAGTGSAAVQQQQQQQSQQPQPQGQNSSTDVVNVSNTSIDSPSSTGAPSPLEDSHTHAQMENGASMDPTMPTLSPHPPLMKNVDKEQLVQKTLAQNDPLVGQNVNNNNASVLVNGVINDTNAFHKPHSSVKLENSALTQHPMSWNHQSLESTKANINSWLRTQQKQVDHKTFKRPCLPTSDCDQDELVTDSLYNFDSVSSWSDFPLKKVCYDRTELMNGIQDLKTSSTSSQNHRPLKSMSPQPPAPDPYAFSDESSSTPATISRGSMRNSRDEIFQRQSPFRDEEKTDLVRNGDSFGFKEDRSNMEFSSITSPPTTPGTHIGGSLTREVDLKPQYSDLDNMFDTDSDDDAFVPQSPPKSVEDIKSTKLPNTGPVDAVGVIAPSELARMYPTPPSLENNPALSPMTSIDAPVESHAMVMDGISYSSMKTEVVIPGNSLIEELSKDGLAVYKPDVQAQFPSSSKYAPVELYSSQLSPPPQVPDYKPSWQYHLPMPDKHVSHYINLPSVENLPSIPSTRMPSSAIEASPAMFQNSVGQQKTPMSYELQSPASNASSYLNKTPNSNMNHQLGTNNQIPEAHSLLVNLLLSDSILNLFKDHNFDSCNICVCNMTIKGSDVGVYIPNPTGEQEYKCTCGFSAVMNRKFGHFAGLFYEDEVEITGIPHDNHLNTRKPNLLTLECDKVDENGVKVVPNVEEMSQSVIQLLIGQFCVPYRNSSTMMLLDKLSFRAQTFPSAPVNLMQLQDGNEVTYLALDHGRQAMEHCPAKQEENPEMRRTCLHKWTFLQGTALIPQNSQECVRLLKGLQPLLQDAIQNKRVTRLWEHTYKLQGPLTWIEFHQLAGRGSDENSEPQPIPSLLLGCDKDAANVSPYTLRYWDKNMLEPYGHRRDIAYVVVTPENDHVMGLVKGFFKELSNIYEWLKLGKHCPISEKLRDGILRVGKTMLQKLGDQEVDEWFKYIGDSPVAAKLKLYAQTCKHYLGPFLAQQTDFKTMFTAHTASQRPANHRPPDAAGAACENLSSSHSEDKDGAHGEGSQRDSHDDIPDIMADEGPAIVIYFINPFTYGNQDWDELGRLSMIGLLRCYQEIVQKLPEFMQNSVYLQIIPVQTIMDARDNGQFHLLKNIAYSVYTSCRWNLTHTVLGRSLTGFGPAAAAEGLLKKKDSADARYRLYNPPFVLAPLKDKQEQLAESCSEKRENSTILLCVYCLSEDQRWLLATCTDEWGETIETCTINIDIPNRHRRKKTSARKIGLGKLWEFILGVISMTSKPCRIVVGRFGRIGHGELKGWSGLLSKKNIQRCSRRMRDMCSQCMYQREGEYPAIISACLISFEQHRSFHIMHDCVKSEEKQRSNCSLQTPRDASCSHILVFPTSATAQANTHQIQLDSTGGMDLGGHNLEFGVDLSDTNIINDFGDNADDFGSLMDVFVSMTENSPPGSPRQDNPGSPGLLDMGRNSPNKLNGAAQASSTTAVSDPQDDAPNLLQQPLAMGYYISTAETGPLPRWFWSACTENESNIAKCFKSALHIHVSTNQDDFMHQTNTRNTHPLDSNLTCDVLRYVLEKYNALSWLTFDPAKNDRTSCLPVHFSVLMQLYHAMNAYV